MSDTDTTHQNGAESNADGRTDLPEGNDTGEQNAGLIEARDRYRTERDSAREELATVTARIEKMQRAEVERLASAALSHPADLFSFSGNELADYLDDDGNVDPVKVASDVNEILAERPGLKLRDLPIDTTQGHSGTAGKSAPKWGGLLTA